MPERFLHQLKKLERIEPREEWLDSTRNFLVNKVKSDSLTFQTPWNYHLRVFLLTWQKKLAPAPAISFSFILAVGLIFGTGLAAQAEHRPDKILYRVRNAVVDMRLALTTSEVKKAEIRLQIVKNRTTDALMLAQSKDLSLQNKEKHLNTVVTKLKQDLEAASASLDIVQTQSDNSAVNSLAKQLTENSKDTVNVLNQVMIESETSGIDKEMVKDVIASTENAEDNALDLLLENNLNGIDGTQLSADEISVLVNDKIKRTEEKVEKIAEIIKQIEVENAISNPASANNQPIAASSNILSVSEEEIGELSANIQQAKDYIAEAKNLAAGKVFQEALLKIKACNQIIKEINELFKEKYGTDKLDILEGEPPSSTGETLKVEGEVEVNDILQNSEVPSTTESTSNVIESNPSVISQ